MMFAHDALDNRKLDERIYVYEKDAFKSTRELARKEGLLVGMSSGAVMFVALRKAREFGKGNRRGSTGYW
jgi:cysteine synthase A